MRALLAGGLVAGSLLLAAPADAGCFGTREVLRVCATPPPLHESEIEQCVYTGGDDCEEVRIPFVTVGRGTSASCTFGSWVPVNAEDPCERAVQILGIAR